MENRTMPPWLRWGSNIALVACVVMIVLLLGARRWETAAELICFTIFWVWGTVHFRPR